jgi:hypothetical protein
VARGKEARSVDFIVHCSLFTSVSERTIEALLPLEEARQQTMRKEIELSTKF